MINFVKIFSQELMYTLGKQILTILENEEVKKKKEDELTEEE